MGLFDAKILRVEVTEGIDIESGAYLTGDRITVGTGPNDSLCLGAGDIAPEHLTLIRQPGAKTWEYFTSDRAATLIDKGNPRTGKVRPGMWFQLGGETRVDILSVPMPADMKETAGDEGKKEVPLALALPIMGMMLGAFVLMFALISRTGGTDAELFTRAWFTDAEPIEPYIDECLEAGPGDPGLRVPGSAPDALFREFAAATPSRASEIKSALYQRVRRAIVDSHLLVAEGRFGDAANSMRRVERMLPVQADACVLMTAAQTDLAVLELLSGS